MFGIDGVAVGEKKLTGPVHWNVVPGVVLEAVRLSVLLAQIGASLLTVRFGAGLTTTFTTVGCEVQFRLLVTVTLYTPLAATVAFTIAGFCRVEKKLLGPVQVKLGFTTPVEAVSCNVENWQSGELEPAVGAAGALGSKSCIAGGALSCGQPFRYTSTLP